MGKLGRGLRAYAIVALLGSAGLAGLAAAPASASRGCPEAALRPQPGLRAVAHPPARAVLACVGRTPITGARFAHSFAILHHELKALGAASGRSIAMASLVEVAAAEAEAREQHIVVTARDVRRSFDHLLRTRYRPPGSFQRYLKLYRLSRADVRAKLREDLLVAALYRHLSHAELAGYNAKWKSRTTCARAFADGDLCGLIAPFGAGPPALGVGGGPEAVAVDPVSDTVYVTSGYALTLIDGKTCNASTTSGCTRARAITLPHTGPRGIAIDATTETIYLAASETDSIAVLDARTCNATTVSGCSHGARVSLGRGIEPEQPVIDSSTHTLYVRDHGARVISVIDAGACNATNHSGCAKPPARLRTADESPRFLAVSPATSTLYVANNYEKTVSVVDARKCSALDTSGCATRWPTVELDGYPLALTVDASTGTLYVPDDRDEVSVIDANGCYGALLIACREPGTVQIGGDLGAIAIDAATRTAYLAHSTPGGVMLLDAATCNATVRSGCARRPRLARTGRKPSAIAIDERTRTVYVANAVGDSVSLIRADSCNATTIAGC